MKTSGGFDGGYFPAPNGQDQPVNISIEHRTLNFQLQPRPSPMMLQNGAPLDKRASLHMQKTAGTAPGSGAGAAAENRKGIQTAPKTFKRQHQVPAIPQISQKLGHMNSQVVGKASANAVAAQGDA